ncbi:MAG: XdhC family protein [Gemmatimonadota bacterium]|nr:XdhC family protein [Gemmatimonadota bacterium]MDH5758067.1 XdhC family protein [Gemmatimonadota bacterium]
MFDEFFHTAQELRAAGKPFATAVVVRAEKPTSGKPGDRAIVTLDGTMHGWIGGSCAQPTVVREALRAMADDTSRLIRLSPDPGTNPVPDGIMEVPMTCFSGGTLDIFIEPHQPATHLLVVGSLPVAQALAHLGKAMSYRVTAVDPTGSGSMAHADEVLRDVADIPSRVTPLTFVVVATHGEYDEPALKAAVNAGAPYIGLVASRTRGEAVLASLAQDGLGEDGRAAIKYPAGLDIQAKRGDEIAVSIVAEIVQTRRGMGALSWTGAEEEAKGCCGGGSGDAAGAAPETALDPICGMTVKIEGAHHTFDHEGRTYYFCCGGCRTKFAADPEAHLAGTV